VTKRTKVTIALKKTERVVNKKEKELIREGVRLSAK